MTLPTSDVILGTPAIPTRSDQTSTIPAPGQTARPPTDLVLSVVVPVARETDTILTDHQRHALALEILGPVEFVYVVDGHLPRTTSALEKMARASGGTVRVLVFNQAFGEAAALSIGFKHARADRILTLVPEPQVDPADLPALVRGLDRADMVVAKRTSGVGGSVFGAGKMEWVLKRLLQSPFADLRCRVRALKKEVGEEIVLYGHQHRFFPLLALRHGFKVIEQTVRPGDGLPLRDTSAPLDYSMILDVVTVFFLLKFLKKPFRFFGGFGIAVLALGLLATGWLVFARLTFGTPLVDRPALILSSLMVVLGVQIIAVGLIGEIVTFAYTKDMRDYRIDRIIE
ncbi:MAG TPA: glycosyltransferase [Geminicoccus sp.]|uniref:glycosyltransferase n=1 Tax=Geminicoccus sp. TaxID=2024832 RepID=UPI002E36B0F1|nr:glycosyltransferase [Geminicoccus sp.]HEX2525920.1 glycosyltransferase [Geminicoccus sp.]